MRFKKADEKQLALNDKALERGFNLP